MFPVSENAGNSTFDPVKVYMDDGQYDDTNGTHLIIVTSFIDCRIVTMSRMARICTPELTSQQPTTKQ